jgi:hypothetical protein
MVAEGDGAGEGDCAGSRQDNPNYEDLLTNRVKTAYNNVRTMTDRSIARTTTPSRGPCLKTIKAENPRLPLSIRFWITLSLMLLIWRWIRYTRTRCMSQVTKNARADVPMDDNRLKRYNELKGQASLDPAKFRDTDIMAEDLPRSSKKELLGLQTAAEKRAQDTTGLTRALSSVTPMLNDAGIRRSATDQQSPRGIISSSGRFRLNGISGLKTRGKVPTDKENQTIAAGVLRVAQPAGWFFGKKAMGFEVPDDSKTEIGKAFSTRYGRPPTPAETYQIYQRQLKRESNASK